MKDEWPQYHFKHPSDYQSRLVALLATLPACQQRSEEADWFPAVDILENDEEYLFKVDLPGLTPGAIQMQMDGETLSITGERAVAPVQMNSLRIERPSGVFVRRFALPDDASRTDVHTEFKDGMLELHLRKAPSEEENATSRPIPIEVKVAKSL